ncbi:MAG: hypothetical protein AVDCRST_MAG41-1533 [uncultured Corynebacteriales bacterium]|uniref:Uncharacterized protein n=1 Tax=uncultured Mycobacteriales bacterium TaxID=581187 RepID=A0A6J4I5T1_9ACTN|nr:MAG: hypothetical protein AVDCRST_MAG41-1533 [uncultured Corynebacteriales bacterium]
MGAVGGPSGVGGPSAVGGRSGTPPRPASATIRSHTGSGAGASERSSTVSRASRTVCRRASNSARQAGQE